MRGLGLGCPIKFWRINCAQFSEDTLLLYDTGRTSRMLLDTHCPMSILFLIFAGINLTGMYFNPAMATGHTFGCKGTTAWEHVVVYWIGPFIGCFLAMLMDRMLHIDAAATVALETKKKKWFDTKCTLHVHVPFRWFKDLLVDTQSIPPMLIFLYSLERVSEFTRCMVKQKKNFF